MKLRNRQRQNLRARQVARYVVAITFSTIVLQYAIPFFYSVLKNEDSIGKNPAIIENDIINNGEVVTNFKWNDKDKNTSITSEDIESISEDAHYVSIPNGFSGLAAGKNGKDLFIVLKENELLNADGLDFSIDFHKLETDGQFFSRGKEFEFGFDKDGININYTLTGPNGKSYAVKEAIAYELIDNSTYNCRFLYTPQTGKGEVFINKILIWSNQAAPNCRLTWNEKNNLVIGYKINGNKSDKPVINNIIIKKTGKSNFSPMDLLGFTADLKGKEVAIQWFTAKENGTDYFKIERSFDTKEYQEVGRIKAAGISSGLRTYSLIDSNPNPGVNYYRIGLNNNTSKSIWLPVIAIRIKPGVIQQNSSSSN
jgi:hypothetical protein